MNDEEQIEAYEYIRKLGGAKQEAVEFSKFVIGFPASMSMLDCYSAYIAAKLGPEAISMDTQSKEFSK